jgi:hypothetical protein
MRARPSGFTEAGHYSPPLVVQVLIGGNHPYLELRHRTGIQFHQPPAFQHFHLQQRVATPQLHQINLESDRLLALGADVQPVLGPAGAGLGQWQQQSQIEIAVRTRRVSGS